MLSVTGNANVGNLGTAGLITATGNITGGNLTTGGVLSVTGNANVGNLGTAGNITAGFFLGNGSQLTGIATNSIFNGNSNVSVAANANVTVSVAGNSNIITVTGTGANISGTANISGNANVGNLGTAGNVTAGFFIGNGSQLTGIAAGGATFTTSASVPASAAVGDYWYETDTDILYIYVDDGESDFWLDIVTFPSELANGNSNIMINANSNITVSAAGTANVLTVASTGITIAGNINFNGNLIDSGALIVQTGSNGNLTLSPNGTGVIITTANILPNANATLSLGSTSLRYANVFGVSSSALYADLAEKYWADDNYSAGTVVIFGGTQEITTTSISHDTRVAGVISTAPAYLMNDIDCEGIWLPVALTGRVPTRVRGPVAKGDLVVASDQSGIAIKIDQHLYNPGCVIGKSLEVIDDDSINIIEVVIGRF